MFNLDSFSYRKDPAVRIKRIGIYPLDDEGKTQYYSKKSFIHHYLRKNIPPEFFNEKPFNDPGFEMNEEKKITSNPEEKNTEIKNPNLTIPHNNNTINIDNMRMNTEPNIIRQNDFLNPLNKRYNTISNSAQKDVFNKRNLNILDRNKKLKLKKLDNFKNKSYSINKEFTKTLFSQKPIIHKTISNKNHLAQSFDRKGRLTGLNIFKNKNAKNTNYKLPIIMGGFGNEHYNRIEIIRTGTKDMGENYNPYNFIVPHVNRTKRNIFGSLFHS